MSYVNSREAQEVEPRLRRIHRVGRCGARRGQAMVEFILVAPLYFLLTFGVMDFGRMFFVQMNLQQAVLDRIPCSRCGGAS